MPKAKCAAAFCNNRRSDANKRNLDIVFHAFPSEEPLRSKWLQFCNRGENWTPFKIEAICSVHFKQSDYQMANSPRMWSKSLRRLNHDAVPTIVEGTVLTLAKKKQLDEVTSKQLLEELYHKPEPSELSTNRDHTYSGMVDMEDSTDPSTVLQKIVYRLQKYPNVCALCFKAITDEKLFSSFAYYHDELQCTIEQKFAELSGVPMDEEDYASLHHLLPDKVCRECMKALIAFHQYQRQLECMRKFSTGLAHLLKGNRQPLQELYEGQGTMLVNVLKRLNICHGSADKVTLERLESEVATYGRITKYTILEQQDHTTDTIVTSSAKSGSKKWTCPYEEICREWFMDDASLHNHIRNDHKCFKCRTCGEKIKFYDLYKKHTESHAIARALLLSHNSKHGSWNCEVCGTVFQSKDLLQQHEKFHIDTGNYVCGTCLGAFVSEEKFTNHTCAPSSMSLEGYHPAVEVNLVDSEFEYEEVSHTEESEFLSNVAASKSSNDVQMLSIEILAQARAINTLESYATSQQEET